MLLAAGGCHVASGLAANTTGKAYYQRGNYAMARDEFRRAVMDDPRNADYRHNLALALKKTGDASGAERVLRTNLEHVSAMHQPTYHSLSHLLVEQGRQPEAQDLLQAWSDTQPYVPESNIELAWVQRESGNIPAAEQSLRKALQVNPRNPTALAHLGQLYQDSGQPDRAAAMYQRSLATRWQQPQVQSRLKMLADGSSRPMSRSALMMNPVSVPQTSFASGPMMPMSSARPGYGPVISSPPMPQGMSNPIMAAAPSLGPTPNPSATAASGPMIVNSPPVTFEAPVMNGPALTPNADPAHAQPELTAELPVVDPY